MRIQKYIVIIVIILTISCGKKQIYADLLIENGLVYNGFDTKPNNYSIAIKHDKIVFIGNKNSVNINAKKIIDASNLIVSPGFIDPHTHADRDLKSSKKSHNKPFMFQGITTVVVGNDGNSLFPSSKYFKIYNKNGIGTNVVTLVGHGTVRNQVMGKSDRIATKEEIKQMQNLVQKEMDEGAFGMSTGLFYSPGSYSDTEEVVELAKIVSKNDGIYDTHLRDESSFSIGVINAIKEAIEIGEKANIPIHLSHIKCLGVDVWDKSEEIIELVENAQKRGIKVSANQYPYEASATGLKSAVVPRWAESGGKDSLFVRYKNSKYTKRILEETKKNITRRGGADKLLIVRSKNKSFLGKNLLEISQEMKLLPEVAVFEILKTGYIGVASFNMKADDINNFMMQDWVVTGSDGNSGHPRKYGTFPRKYNKYVLENELIDLSTFINNSTSKTAEIFKIKNRGVLKEGNFADIIIFNPKTFKDKADYSNAFKLSEGIIYSIINGKISIDEGKFSNNLNGRVLKKNKQI